MILKDKPKKPYFREVLDAIQLELRRENIGLKSVEDGYIITDMDSKELVLSTGDEAKIRALSKIMEKLEWQNSQCKIYLEEEFLSIIVNYVDIGFLGKTNILIKYMVLKNDRIQMQRLWLCSGLRAHSCEYDNTF